MDRSFKTALGLDPAGLSQPYTAAQVWTLVRSAGRHGVRRAVRSAPLLSLLCAALYHDRWWGVADGLGWAAIAYHIYFWFELGGQPPVQPKREQHTLWLMPEIDADDSHWWRAGSALTACLVCLSGYLLLRAVLIAVEGR